MKSVELNALAGRAFRAANNFTHDFKVIEIDESLDFRHVPSMIYCACLKFFKTGINIAVSR